MSDLWRAWALLRRVRGKLIGCCPKDENSLPTASRRPALARGCFAQSAVQSLICTCSGVEPATDLGMGATLRQRLASVRQLVWSEPQDPVERRLLRKADWLILPYLCLT